ncbi:MAG: efflux RND transporter permease subunit [Alphaproteobacteria bacterium]
MTSLLDTLISRQRTVLTILIALILAGLYAYFTVPKEADPDIPIPFIQVSAPHPGISPEDAERLLIKPLEARLRSVEGLKEIRSVASLGHAGLYLEFDADFDQQKALTDVRERVDQAKPDLPDDTEDPYVVEFNASLFPVMTIAISGDAPERALLRQARQLQNALEAIPSVLKVEISGAREEILEVIVNPAKLESYNIAPRELLDAVTLNNRLVAAGSMDTGQGRFAVKVPGLFETAADAINLPVKVAGDGVVRLGDLTEIRRAFKDRYGYVHLNGKPAISVSVTKRLGYNILDTSGAVRAIVTQQQNLAPATIRMTIAQDTSAGIYSMLSSLEAAVLTAIAMVMIVVLASLGLSSALLVGLSIPVSFLIGFALFGITGLTINMMVMFGLILSVGMLVDDTIIVVEYADRQMIEGLPRSQAYIAAARRMFWPIVSSTATTLVAFLPMLFWPDVTGKFMRYLPLTMIFVMSASLIVAIVFVPALGAIFGRPSTGDLETLKSIRASEHGDLNELRGVTGVYAQLITRLVRHPVKVIGAAIAMLCIVTTAYAFFGRGLEFFTETDADRANVFVSARGNLSAMEMRDLVFEVEREVLKVEGIRTAFTRTGQSSGGRSGGRPTERIGSIQIELLDWRDRTRNMNDILDEIRERTRHMAGIKILTRKREGGPPAEKDIIIDLTSHRKELLNPAVEKLAAFMRSGASGIIDIEDSRTLPGIEWVVKVDRAQAGRFGADITNAGLMILMITDGIEIGDYRPDDSEDEVEIRVRYPLADRNFDQLDQLRVRTRNGLVPLSNFVTREARPSTGSIERVDGVNVMTVSANVGKDVLSSAKVAEISQWLQSAGLDPDLNVRFRGNDENQQKARTFLIAAFSCALFLIAIILITQFNSFYHSALILSAVAMSIAGVLLGLLIMGQTFSVIMTGTGIVALTGIVVKNNIILIDTYHQLIREGYQPMDAIVRTGAQRLRPVVLTTLTTICGLLPMMLQVEFDFMSREILFGSPSSSWWVQLATAVVFGLSFATVLTLLVTPCALALPDSLRQSLITWRAGRPLNPFAAE